MRQSSECHEHPFLHCAITRRLSLLEFLRKLGYVLTPWRIFFRVPKCVMEESNSLNTNNLEIIRSVDAYDRISNLPNDVLHHIFADVQTKELVQSSVLSKRWRHLWTSMPNLNFDQSQMLGTFVLSWKFMDLIDNVLSSLEDGVSLKRFRILGHGIDWRALCWWIEVVCERKVQEIDLDITSDMVLSGFYSMPLKFGASIVVLKLNLNYFEIPVSINSEVLRTLHLVSIVLPENFLLNIFERCPLVENFSMERCKGGLNEALKISASNLKNLILVKNRFSPSVCPSFPGVLEVFAEKLVSFIYIDYPLLSCRLGNFPSLESASTHFLGSVDDTGHILCKMVRVFNNASIIRLTISVSQFWPKSVCNGCFPTAFDNLKQLYLHARFNKCHMRRMINLLKHSPNLEALTIDTEGVKEHLESYYLRDDEPWFEQVSCLSTHLRKVEIINSYGIRLELEFLKLFLGNGIVLEELVFYWKKKSKRMLKKIRMLLEFLPKASLNVAILFPEREAREPFWLKYCPTSESLRSWEEQE